MINDNTLAANVRDKNCEEWLTQLIDRHTPLCYNILQKFYPLLHKNGYNKEDIFNDKDFLIYKSAITFKSKKKTKYSTWLGNYTRYHCLNLLNARKNQNFISIEEPSVKEIMETEASEEKGTKTKNTKEYLSHILDELKDKRVKKIYMMRYFSKDGKRKTWKEIATEVGVSSQTVINIHNKAKRILKNKFKSKNNYDFV